MSHHKDFLMLVTGIMLGYVLVQGLAFVNSHYLWVLFYR